jgi:hypothetical protein
MSQTQANPDIVGANDQKPRITAQDVEAIALYVARGLNETQAVLKHGLFRVQQWWNWKCKAKRTAKFAECVSRLKAQRIDANLREIEKAATGQSGVRHDWRAADRMLSIIAPEQFAPKSDVVNNNVAVLVTEDTLKGILDRVCRQKATTELKDLSTKQLSNSDANSPNTQDISC